MPITARSGRLALLALLAFATPRLAAQEFQAGDLVVRQPWARATPNGAKVAGGYLTVINRGTVPDALTGGTFAAASDVAIHTMTTEGGIMRMRPAGPLEIPPGGSVTLSPEGTHIMFTGLKRGLKAGEEVDGTLVFARAGSVPVRFAVEGIGAKGWTGAGHGAMPGMRMD